MFKTVCVRDAISPQTFYAPDLTPFVRRLRGAGVPLFAASYASALDTIDSRVDDITLFSASVVVPGTAHLIEARARCFSPNFFLPHLPFFCHRSWAIRSRSSRVRSGQTAAAGVKHMPCDITNISLVWYHEHHESHSPSLVQVVSERLDAELQPEFADGFPGSACGRANELSASVTDLRGLWADSGGVMANGAGLPDLMIAKVGIGIGVGTIGIGSGSGSGSGSESVIQERRASRRAARRSP